MPIKTLDIDKITEKSNNKYEKVVILSKRARQIAAEEKMEIDEKLKYFEGFEDEDEFTFNEEQQNISRMYEELPHATQRAVHEMEKDQTTFRYPERES